MYPLVTVVYRSNKKAGAYLFVTLDQRLDVIPEQLMQQLGTLEEVMTFKLTPERKLAQANAQKVIDALQAQGYYLQLPPPIVTAMGAS